MLQIIEQIKKIKLPMKEPFLTYFGLLAKYIPKNTPIVKINNDIIIIHVFFYY